MLAVLNIGSSSAKFALFDARDAVLARGQIFPDSQTKLRAVVANKKESARWEAPADQWPAAFFQWAEQRLPQNKLRAVGHRIVHGGNHFRAPALLDQNAIATLESLAPLAPLHIPPAVAVVRQVAAARPDLPQVGCFDTAFHATIPARRRRLPLPKTFADAGIVRYGFHGLSYQNIAEQSPRVFGENIARQNIVALHLGGGASACGIANGQSRATTMGTTPLDGLVMGTRCGALDPGVVLHLVRECNLSPDEAEDILSKKSGLLGLSGISADMRDLSASDSPDAKLAVEVFCESAARHAAAVACDIGGINALAFTGGVGENNPDIRRAVCEKLRFVGAKVDDDANNNNAQNISATDSAIAIAVVPADEERVIARGVRDELKKRNGAV